MNKLLFLIIVVLVSTSLSVQAQDSIDIQSVKSNYDKEIVQTPITVPAALVVYIRWRDESLRNYPQGTSTPHFALSITAQRLDDHTAQIEVLVAADMKHYTISVRPVTLARQASGEYLPTPVRNAVVIDQKAGRKLTQGPDKIRLGEMTTLVKVTRETQALEITWEPKNDKKDDQPYTSVVLLSKEPTTIVNGYILAEPNN